MEIKSYSLGPFQTNCYILSKKDEVIIIDPSAKGEKLAEGIGDQKKVLAILLTHGHFDHFGGAQVLLDRFNCPVYIHKDDQEMLIDPKLNYSYPQSITLDTTVELLEPGNLTIGSFSISVFHTPGHSLGSCSFLIENNFFCGDVLFKDSIGRTDLIGGNQRELMKSLKFIKSFSDNLSIYPGHGPKTTLNQEKISNPFLK